MRKNIPTHELPKQNAAILSSLIQTASTRANLVCVFVLPDTLFLCLIVPPSKKFG